MQSRPQVHRAGPLRVWVLAVLCAACATEQAGLPVTRAPAPVPPASAELSALDYTFAFDESLSRATVRVCMQGAAPTHFVYGAASAMRYVRSPRALDTAGRDAAALPMLDLGFSTQGLGTSACFAYDLDFSGGDDFYTVRRGAGFLLTTAELLLFRPPRRQPGLRASARFVLPAGAQASLPWPMHDGAYVLDESVFAFMGHVAIGRMERERLSVPAAELDVAVLPGFASTTRPLLGPWLRMVSTVVASTLGKFPAPRAQVILVPTGGPSPMRFGHVGRSGGASVVLFVPEAADPVYLREDWIAIHELSHLVLPFVRREDAWFSEGVATYLQDVLRARAGLLGHEELWQRMHQGAQYGLAAQGTLAEETKIMPTAGNYQRVYWAGAIITLLMDVELRERSQGRHTLGSVLAALDDLRVRPDRPYSAIELVEVMEKAAGVPLVPLVTELVHAPRFPTVDALYLKLGLRSDGKRDPSRSAPLSWIADAITARSVEAPSLAQFHP